MKPGEMIDVRPDTRVDITDQGTRTCHLVHTGDNVNVYRVIDSQAYLECVVVLSVKDTPLTVVMNGDKSLSFSSNLGSIAIIPAENYENEDLSKVLDRLQSIEQKKKEEPTIAELFI